MMLSDVKHENFVKGMSMKRGMEAGYQLIGERCKVLSVDWRLEVPSLTNSKLHYACTAQRTLITQFIFICFKLLN